MSETDPGYSEQYAGNVGARRATVGTPTERESINVPPTRPGAAENARRVEEERTAHETFAPEPIIPDERAQALEREWAEAESPRHHHHSGARHTPGTAGGTGHQEESNVRKEIQETRRELGETVGALAAKADVKARAAHVAETAKDRAADVAGSVKEKATEMAGKVREGTPHQVKDAAGQARKRPMLLVAAAGAVTAFVVRRMMQRRHRRPHK
ncbi:DUF3618 domain-containing protein [Nonomuraea jabiensis]|uniref:DUF3618 domain-containing protein n=1 Tax=Nonomuraea jabiensis TaxID=882448 RepID=A0A7W9GIW3_9ACTN|nr:DUF3618 domain-containing protein [Nonomuraea jabiensis]MBB5784644.1 hypothetical protein [Nonomuraea jabiensis]